MMAALSVAVLVGCGGASNKAPLAPDPATVATPAPPVGPPNVVLILADDLGYGDLRGYHDSGLRTPTIQRLMDEGTRFTDFYVPQPVCAPSRAALLSGRWGIRNGIRWNTGALRLAAGEVLLPSVLRARGYATGMVGKWHMGSARHELPPAYGFDFFYGVKNSPPNTDFVAGDQVTTDYPGMDLVTERFTAESLKFLRGTAGRPVFLYVAHHVAHTPHFASASFVGRTSRAYSDAIIEMDDSIARTLSVLAEQGRENNTLVLFLSDNGPENIVGGSAGDFIGTKGTVQEGGVRVPLIAWWPGRIPGGRVVSEPASSLDLFPTIVNFTGATMPARHYDGQSIAATLTGEGPRLTGPGIDGGREFLFWGDATGTPAAIRSGRWKFIRGGTAAASSGRLFDLETDRGEQMNLVRSRPDIAALLLRRMSELAR
jgi:arylsulfatase A-like enzyme